MLFQKSLGHGLFELEEFISATNNSNNSYDNLDLI